MSMPKQKPGRSKQDYGTPTDFLDAVKKRLSIEEFSWDLAADENNKVCWNYWSESSDSLKQNWHQTPGWCWLNPPFGNIRPWVAKCVDEARKGCHIAVLVPTSHAKWWLDYVEGKCYINYLHGRLTFVGESKPYPKDCALLLYTPWGMTGNEVWDWKTSVTKSQQPLVSQTTKAVEVSVVTSADTLNILDSIGRPVPAVIEGSFTLSPQSPTRTEDQTSNERETSD